MFRTLTPMTALALPLGLLLAACNTPEPVENTDSSGGGKEDTLFPIGSENLGYLVVQQPDGSAVGLSQAASRLFVDGKPASFGATTRLPAGSHSVVWSLENGSPTGSMSATAVAKTTTVVVGAGIHVSGALDFPVTFGSKLRSTTPWEPNSYVFEAASEPGRFVPVGPGDFAFSLSLEDFNTPPLWSNVVTLASGEVKAVDLSPPELRGKIVIKPPTRMFPTVRQETWFAASRSYSAETLASYPVQGGAYREKYLLNPSSWAENVGKLASDLEHTVLGNTAWTRGYFLWLNGTYVNLEVAPGGTTVVQMQRLDVDDVEVTREDGTTFRTEGRYSIEWLTPAGTYVVWPELQNLPTKTGVDLVAGHYRVTVSYNTLEPPGPKQDVYEIDLD